jgi:hypothetical protein
MKAIPMMMLAAVIVATLAAIPPLQARERRTAPSRQGVRRTAPAPHDVLRSKDKDEQGRTVVYRKKNVVDFDSMLLEGDLKNPNEFYFVHRPEEKFGTLVKKRPNFHKEMLRDSVMVR